MMEPAEYGCREECPVEEDNESIRDECWVAKYKGDSRKWLIRDASYKNKRTPLISSMKASYTQPADTKKQWENLGTKKSILLKQFYQEASHEVLKEYNAPPTPVDYCTEYDGNYRIPGFEVDNEPHTKNPELYQKYPLYGAMPTTFYSYSIENQYPKQYTVGLTKSKDCRSPFRRSAGFTTPLSEKLDDATR